VIIITVLSFFSIWALREKSNAIAQQQIAEEQKDLAFRAKETAEAAQKEAMESRSLAEKEKKLADSTTVIAILNEKEALRQRELARSHQAVAEKNAEMARNQEQIANSERLKAENARSEALNAESQTRRLNYISIAQNIALRSSGMEKNPELMGILAVQAFTFNKRNKGRAEDPIIYEALGKAFLALDSSEHSVFTGSSNEIRVLHGQDDGTLLSADLEGNIRIWTPEGKNMLKYTLPFQSPADFIRSGSTGEWLLSQHDNRDVILWKIGSKDNTNPDYQKLSGYNDYVRCLAFSPDRKYLVTASADSNVIVWDITVKPAVKLNYLTTGSVVRAVVFCSGDSLIMAQEDGVFVTWNVNRKTTTPLFASADERPICLAWNKDKNTLLAGCSNGSLLVFDLNSNKPVKPSAYTVHTSGIDLISFNSDYTLLSTSGWDKSIKFYNYEEFFERGNAVGGAKHIRNINSRVRSLVFTAGNKLAAGLSDRSIRIWETSSEKLASLICALVKRDLTQEEWNSLIGEDIPYENSCRESP